MKPPPPGTYDTADILWSQPPSGEYPELSFGPTSGNTLWVLFSESMGPGAWVGKFGCGPRTVMRLSKGEDPALFFVLSGGFPYLVDAHTQRLREGPALPDGCMVNDMLYDRGFCQWIVADYRLIGVTGGSIAWQSERFSTDSIDGLRVDGAILSGYGYRDYDGLRRRFTFDLSDCRFLGWGAPAP
jgi:hypothetical protein